MDYQDLLDIAEAEKKQAKKHSGSLLHIYRLPSC